LWTYTATGATVAHKTCGTYTILGGVRELVTEPFTKTYTLAPTVYGAIDIDFVVMGIDNWITGEQLIVELNGQTRTFDLGQEKALYGTNVLNQCDSGLDEFLSRTLKASFDLPCGTTQIRIEFRTNLQTHVFYTRDEAFGIISMTITGYQCSSNCLCCKINPTYECLACNTMGNTIVLQSGLCLPCDVSCIGCEVNTFKCQTCALGYYRNPYDYQCKSTCPPSFMADSATRTCVPCDNQFCLQCDVVKSQCQRCAAGSFLNGVTCVTKCPAGTTEITGANPYCQPCPSNCLECNTNSAFCDWCNGNYYVHPTSKLCVSSCPPGYKANPLTRQCDPCSDTNCLKCDQDVNVCTQCSAAYNLLPYAGTCVNPCPIGWVKDVAINQCVDCADPNCELCNPSTLLCLKCSGSTFFDVTTQSCVFKCPLGYRHNTVTRTCDKCTVANCLTCEGSVSMCEDCSGAFVIGPTGQCITSCPDNYGKNLASDICHQCNDPQCKVCDGSPYSCDQCMPGFFYHKTKFICINDHCGNARRTGITIGGSEWCDDGNTVSGDGCSSTCDVEPNYYCYGGDDMTIDTCIKYVDNKDSPYAVVYYRDYYYDQFIIHFNMEVVHRENLKDLIYIVFADERNNTQNVFSDYEISLLPKDYNDNDRYDDFPSTKYSLTMHYNTTFQDLTVGKLTKLFYFNRCMCISSIELDFPVLKLENTLKLVL